MTFSKKIIFPVFTFFLFVLILFSGCTQNTSSDTKKLHCIYIAQAPKTEYTYSDLGVDDNCLSHLYSTNTTTGNTTSFKYDYQVALEIGENTLVVKAHYTDGSVADVTAHVTADVKFNDWISLDLYNNSQSVHIYYTESSKTVSTSFTVKVVSPKITACSGPITTQDLVINCSGDPITINKYYMVIFEGGYILYLFDGIEGFSVYEKDEENYTINFLNQSFVVGSGGSGTTNCSHPRCSISTTTPPTCIKSGSITYICDSCGTVITQTLFPLGYCESPIDATTYSNATNGSTYVYFGVFPQTVLASESDITIDENNSVTIGGITYYVGSDREYYARVTEDASGNFTYSDGSTVDINNKKNRYFKMEPIKWRVVDTGFDIDDDSGSGSGSETGVLLVADEILTSNVPFYKTQAAVRNVGEDTTIYSNNYKYSQLRAYLNGIDYYDDSNSATNTYTGKGFLQTAFTSDAQKVIKTTTVDNSAESTVNADTDNGTLTAATNYVCDNTQDKIFLLSTYEVTKYSTEAYNTGITTKNGHSRSRLITDYAKANYAVVGTDYNDGTGAGPWWLRSPYYSEDTPRVQQIFENGYCFDNSADVFLQSLGIVPALCVSFE